MDTDKTASVELIPLDAITESKLNPREKETPEELEDLVNSIKEKGLQQPILVNKMEGTKGYELVDGHRRFWAHQILNEEYIQALVMEIDSTMIPEYQLVCNLQRVDPHPLHLAELYATLTGRDREKIIQLAARIGKKPHDVHEVLNLINLTKKGKDLFARNQITVEHAKLLAKMTPEDQEKALDFFLEDHEYGEDAVRTFKEYIDNEITFNLSNAPWDKSDANLIPGVVSCDECPRNSAFNTTLFPDAKGKGFCGDRACFKAKLEAYKVQMHKKARKEEGMPFILISTQHTMDPAEPMKIKDVKLSGRYVTVKDGKECENTKRAQWIDGPNKGKFTKVCNYSKCPKHFKGQSGPETRSSSRDDYNSPANVLKRERAAHDEHFKRMLNQQTNWMIFLAGMEKEKKSDTSSMLRALIITQSDRLHGLDLLRSHIGLKDSDSLDNFIERADYKSLIILANFVLHNDMFSQWEVDAADQTDVFIKKYKINQASVRKQAEEVINLSVHQCEYCHCLEDDPWDDECSWDPTFKAAGRYVCSNCTDKVKPIKKTAETKEPAPKAKKQKKGRK